MRQQSFFFRLIVLAQAILLAACTGDDAKDLPVFNDFYDLRLASLEVIEGGTLYWDGEQVEEFDNTRLTGYSVALDDQFLSQITLRATRNDSSTQITVIERRKGNDGSDRVTPLTDDNNELNVAINEGPNVVLVRVNGPDGRTFNDYIITVDRVSTTASLASVSVVAAGQDTNTAVTFTPAIFDADILNYTASVVSSACGVNINAVGSQSGTITKINGVGRSRAAASFINFSAENEIKQWLCPGDETLLETSSQEEELALQCPGNSSNPSLQQIINRVPVEIEVISEDGGDSKLYQVIFEREPEQTERDSEVFLGDISIPEGRAANNFKCNTDQMFFTVNNNTVASGIKVFSGNSEMNLVIGKAPLNTSGTPTRDQATGIWLATAPIETLVSGDIFTESTLTNLNEGNNYLVINVLSSNSENLGGYLINIFRDTKNTLQVSTAEQLQSALVDALPNDEIVITAGVYTAEINEDSNEAAHFYSVASGTEDQPIFLRGEGTVRLTGNNLSENAVMHLRGSHWQIRNIEFTGAQNGLVLSGANETELSNLRFENLGERALIVDNDSSNNLIRDSYFDKTGIQPQARDGIDKVYGEAIVVGSGESNSIQNNVFARNIANEAITIESAASHTAVQFNQFLTDNTLPRVFPERMVIQTQGAATEISYNTFSHNHISFGTDEISQIIATNTTLFDEFATEVYQNIFDLDGQPFDLVGGLGGGEVRVSDNIRKDSVEVSYAGTVDPTFTTPKVQIQSNLDPTKCFANRLVAGEGEEITEASNYVILETCADDDAQHWQLIHDDGTYVFLQSATNASDKITVREGRLIVRTDNKSVFDQATPLRWKTAFSREGLATFTNKSNQQVIYEILSENTETPSENTNARLVFVGSPNPATTNSNFRLVRLP